MGRHTGMAFLLTNSQDHSPHGKGNKLNIVGVASVPKTSPVSNKPILVVLTEGKQRPFGRQRPVPKSQFIPALSIDWDWCSLISS